jgi:hypothetical protein
MRPRLSLPREIRTQFIARAITGFGLMALVGFYAALMPSMLSHDLHIKNQARPARCSSSRRWWSPS